MEPSGLLNGGSQKLVLGIMTAPASRSLRDSCRETWLAEPAALPLVTARFVVGGRGGCGRPVAQSLADEAARHGDHKMVGLLINSKVNLYVTDRQGNTALLLAALSAAEDKQAGYVKLIDDLRYQHELPDRSTLDTAWERFHLPELFANLTLTLTLT